MFALALWRSIAIGLLIGGWIIFGMWWWTFLNEHVAPRFEAWAYRRFEARLLRKYERQNGSEGADR